MPDERDDDDELGERRGTFRPPFDPQGNRFSKERADAENFTFSKRERDSIKMRTLKSAENPFKGVLPNSMRKQNSGNPIRHS